MTAVIILWSIFAVLALLTTALLFFEALREKERELQWRIREFDGEQEFNPKWKMSVGSWRLPDGEFVEPDESYRSMDCRSYEVDE